MPLTNDELELDARLRKLAADLGMDPADYKPARPRAPRMTDERQAEMFADPEFLAQIASDFEFQAEKDALQLERFKREGYKVAPPDGSMLTVGPPEGNG